MGFSDEFQCHICKLIFCCGKCRHKHQVAKHAIVIKHSKSSLLTTSMVNKVGTIMSFADDTDHNTIYLFCPICERNPLILRPGLYPELLAHIENVHLPLQCQKCLRHYNTPQDLRAFTKCTDIRPNFSGCLEQSCKTDVNLQLSQATTSISTQTSPSLLTHVKDLKQLKSISLMNAQWKAKGKMHDDLITDSVSSIRNLSSISNTSARHSIGQLTAVSDTVRKGKLIRTTSTPLHMDPMFAKLKEPLTFNASSGGHMSSICNSLIVDTDHHNSGFLPTNNINNAMPMQPIQRTTWKMSSRAKMSAVTPLQQLMGKNIQKALVEHRGLPIQMGSLGLPQQCTLMDLTENNNEHTSIPLDLRTSPAVRRTQNETNGNGMNHQGNNNTQCEFAQYQRMLLSSQKLTTESIIITRTKLESRAHQAPESGSISTATAYNSCESLEIITSASAAIQKSGSIDAPPITPISSIPGANINKKLINFETPAKDILSIEKQSESRDIFYTPHPGTPEQRTNEGTDRRRAQIVPRQLSGQFSPEKLPKHYIPTNEHKMMFNDMSDNYSNETNSDVFQHGNNNEKSETPVSNSNAGCLWSLMTSVIRLPATIVGDLHIDKDKKNSGPTSLLKRCASIAGSFVAKKSDDSYIQSMKRKRTQTCDNLGMHSRIPVHDAMSPSNDSKRFRIQPRQPMERMRNKT